MRRATPRSANRFKIPQKATASGQVRRYLAFERCCDNEEATQKLHGIRFVYVFARPGVALVTNKSDHSWQQYRRVLRRRRLRQNSQSRCVFG